jgi:hypothetical protein
MSLYLGLTTSAIRAALHALLPDGGATQYVGLLTAFGEAADGSDVTEASVARVGTNAWMDITTEVEGNNVSGSANTNDLTFETLGGALTIKGVAIYTASSGGTPKAIGLLLGGDGPLDSLAFGSGDTPQIDAGSILVAIDRMVVG